MSTVEEIEAAIERLGTVEFAALKSWLDRHDLKRTETLEERRLTVLRKTSGCLSKEDAEDFARAVQEVGQDIPDSHDW